MFSNISTKFMFIHFPVASITAIRSWLNTEGETAGKQRCLCRALPGILLHSRGVRGRDGGLCGDGNNTAAAACAAEKTTLKRQMLCFQSAG